MDSICIATEELKSQPSETYSQSSRSGGGKRVRDGGDDSRKVVLHCNVGHAR